MTPAMRAWLTKLRDEGPQRPCKHGWEHMRRARKAGLCTFGPHGEEWTEPLNGALDVPWIARITPAGLAALADAEGGKP